MSSRRWWVAIHDPELGYLDADDFDVGDCPTCDGEGGWTTGGYAGAMRVPHDCPDCEGSGTLAYNYRDTDPFPVEPAKCSICSGKVAPDANYPLCALHEASSREGGKALAWAQRYEEDVA